MEDQIIVQDLKCERCGYEWRHEGESKPEYCANEECRSPYWEKPTREDLKRMMEALKDYPTNRP